MESIAHELAGVLRLDAAHRLDAFLRGPAAHFRVALDDTCMLGADWHTSWMAPPIQSVVDPEHAHLDRQWWGDKYGAAGFVPWMLEQASLVTTDWRAAHAIVVVFFAHQSSGLPSITQQQCLQKLQRDSESFRTTAGERHFFLLTGDNGPCCVDGRYKDVGFLKHRIIGNHGQVNQSCSLSHVDYHSCPPSHARVLHVRPCRAGRREPRQPTFWPRTAHSVL